MSTMNNGTLDAKSPRGPIAEQVGRLQGAHEAGQPEQQAQLRDHRRRHRPGRRVGGGHAGRARLQGEGLHLPRLAAPGPLHRRPGRHQRRQELQGRRRQHLPPLLRHREGRRLPQPREQRLPPGPGQRSNIIDQCVAQGVPFAREYGGLLDNRSLRRRSGQPHVLRPGPDRPAAAARRLPGAGPSDRARHGRALQPLRDARRRGGRTVTPPASSCATSSPARSARTPATPWCWPPAATRTPSSCPRTRWPATPRPSGGPIGGAPTSPTRASPRSTRRASPRATSSSRSSR